MNEKKMKSDSKFKMGLLNVYYIFTNWFFENWRIYLVLKFDHFFEKNLKKIFFIEIQLLDLINIYKYIIYIEDFSIFHRSFNDNPMTNTFQSE